MGGIKEKNTLRRGSRVRWRTVPLRPKSRLHFSLVLPSPLCIFPFDGYLYIHRHTPAIRTFQVCDKPKPPGLESQFNPSSDSFWPISVPPHTYPVLITHGVLQRTILPWEGRKRVPPSRGKWGLLLLALSCIHHCSNHHSCFNGARMVSRTTCLWCFTGLASLAGRG